MSQSSTMNLNQIISKPINHHAKTFYFEENLKLNQRMINFSYFDDDVYSYFYSKVNRND